jgi:aminoglycoside phosphotransferase family enzyme/predicted kinase
MSNPAFVVENQDEALAALGEASTYGVSGPLERAETHGAAVFLVGDRAYKMKRAVRFPYMDFGTLERRRAMCAAEVEVNRRFAPDLYLGVAALQEHGGRWRIGPLMAADDPALAGTEAREWLVVMRRFPASGLFATMADENRLDAALLVGLARRIAAAHDAAAVSRAHAAASDYAQSVATDIAQMRAHADVLDRDAGEWLAEAMPAALAPVAALVDRRRQAGAVRRCHGDLHLGNVCLLDGQPTLFDAIEFSDRIGNIDILYDLAFLLMDLDHRGRRDFANAVLNHWLWHIAEVPDAGNDEALALLPLFLSRRASIRAHVGASAAKVQADRSTIERATAAARSYQHRAVDYLHPASARLIAVGGLSGSGKSTQAHALAHRIGRAPGAVVVRSDIERKRMAGVPLDARMPPGSYTRERSAEVYAAILARAARCLRAGQSVIVDAVFADPGERRAVEDVAREAGVPFMGLWLGVTREVALARVEARRGDASDATPRVVERQQAYDLGVLTWARVDAGRDTETVTADARRIIGA